MDNTADVIRPRSKGEVDHTLNTLVVSSYVSTRMTHGAHLRTYCFAIALDNVAGQCK